MVVNTFLREIFGRLTTSTSSTKKCYWSLQNEKRPRVFLLVSPRKTTLVCIVAKEAMITSTASQERERKAFLAKVRRREKIVGADAIRAAELGIGELFRSGNGDFALSTVCFGIKTPPRPPKELTDQTHFAPTQ